MPTLARDDGSVLTEFPAIAYWLAQTNPSGICCRTMSMARRARWSCPTTRCHHPHAGLQAAVPAANFTPTAADEEAVKARGKEIADKGFAIVDKALEGKDYAVGKFSIADAAIFYVEFWAKRVELPLPANCAAHFDRMMARPAVQRVMQQEGLA